MEAQWRLSSAVFASQATGLPAPSHPTNCGTQQYEFQSSDSDNPYSAGTLVCSPGCMLLEMPLRLPPLALTQTLDMTQLASAEGTLDMNE